MKFGISRFTEVHANCVHDIILKTTKLLTNKYSHPWINNYYSPNQPISGCYRMYKNFVNMVTKLQVPLWQETY